MTLNTDGLSEAVYDLQRDAHRAVDASPALETSVFHWQSAERRRFAGPGRFGRRDSRAWAQEKRRRGLDPRTMRAHGRAESALVNATRSEGVVARATRTTLVVGVARGRSNIYYLRPLAKRGFKTVAFDKPAKIATGETVLHYLLTGVVRVHAS